MQFLLSVWNSFYDSFFAANRWRFYVEGLGNTLIMAGMAAIVGLILGFILAIIKVSAQARSHLRPGIGKQAILVAGKAANLYTTVIRGTPVMLQLIVFYYGVFRYVPKEYSIFIAGLSFGINSGAYICEIIRSGIQSVESGQTEAARALGLSQSQTMRYIVLPQAVKNSMPTLFNEFITLLKETSVAGYIALNDLTRAGDIIRYRVITVTPLVISGAIYLVLVILLTKIQNILEQRLGAEHRPKKVL